MSHKVTPVLIRIEIDRSASNFKEARWHYFHTSPDVMLSKNAFKTVHPMHDSIVQETRGNREHRQLTIETYTNTNTLPEGAAAHTHPGILLPTMTPNQTNPPQHQQHQSSTSNGADTDGGTTSKRLLQPPAMNPPVQFGDILFDIDQYKCDQHDWLEFTSGNPFVEVTTGIIHFYKKTDNLRVEDLTSDILCLISVPATFSCHDILNFVAPYHGDLYHIRIIRDDTPNSFMVILDFRTSNAAQEFYRTYNDVSYSSLEDKVCHVVFVSGIEYTTLPTAPMYHTEVPTCSLCLSQVTCDDVTGLTVMCDHQFHVSCLNKWSDSTCPVCMYEMTPELIDRVACMNCEATQALWICLICGHIGCGRAQNGHSADHFRKTEHAFALQVGTERVWDYAGDNYVDRLLLNQVDGQLVPHNGIGDERLELKTLTKSNKDIAGELLRRKQQEEFTQMLSTQLDAQRDYFEEKLQNLEKRFDKDIRRLKDHTLDLQNRNASIEKSLEETGFEKSSMEEKLQLADTRLNLLMRSHIKDKYVVKALQNHMAEWQTKYDAIEYKFRMFQIHKETETRELNEQIKDLIYYMNAQSKLIRDDLLMDSSGAARLAAHAAKYKAKREQEANNNNNNNPTAETTNPIASTTETKQDTPPTQESTEKQEE